MVDCCCGHWTTPRFHHELIQNLGATKQDTQGDIVGPWKINRRHSTLAFLTYKVRVSIRWCYLLRLLNSLTPAPTFLLLSNVSMLSSTYIVSIGWRQLITCDVFVSGINLHTRIAQHTHSSVIRKLYFDNIFRHNSINPPALRNCRLHFN